jgi:hypothetical protein
MNDERMEAAKKLPKPEIGHDKTDINVRAEFNFILKQIREVCIS